MAPTQAYVEKHTAGMRAMLAHSGLTFHYEILGIDYRYDRNLLQEAFQAAPDSKVGQQAFMDLIASSFHPGFCTSEGFEDVIRQTPHYLAAHSRWSIRPDVLLALGDAHRDIVVLAKLADMNTAETPDNAAVYKPRAPQAYRDALRYYRLTMAADPYSDAARTARRKAWQLLAGIAPIDGRFLCVDD